jgi:hypothetical protein
LSRRLGWRRGELLAAPTTYPKQDASCWTDEYLLRHCEEYRVDLLDVHVGYVEEIVLLPDESTPIGFLVRGVSGLTFVSVHQIRDFSPRAQRIVVDPLPLIDRVGCVNSVSPTNPRFLERGPS